MKHSLRRLHFVRPARRAFELGLALGLVLTVVLTARAERRARVAAQIRADTIRLHVLANSDTLEDQLLKLQVRDAVLAALPAAVTQAETPQQAAAALQAALPALNRAVQDALLHAHSPQSAAVRLETLDFAARDYGDFALPAGQYTALRVELGRAAGHNWFCVLYPALCVSGARAEYPTDAENELVFGRYRVRFALLDEVRALVGHNSET